MPKPVPVPDLSAAAAAAGAAVSEPAPPPAPEPEPEPEPLPEDQDTFPREYVEELRAENAKARTRGRDIEAAFVDYEPAQKERFLKLATQLVQEPEAALKEFEDVTNNLRKQLGKEAPVAEEAPPPAPEPVVESEPAPAQLTAEDVNRLVAERMDAERQATAQQDDVNATFAQAAAINDSYAPGSPALVHLLAVAQNDPAANGTLEGAHEVIQAQLQSFADAAVEEYRQGITTGALHPPRLNTGDPTAGKTTGPPTTLAEAKARADERLNATYD